MEGKSAASVGFDRLLTLVLSLTIGGFFADLWAHSHGQVESFFTVWHLALYSAAGSVFVILAIAWARGRRRGASWRDALPDGYGLSFLGSILFMVGGGLDLAWHLAFGIETNISALFSPTHILLFSSGVLMMSGPLRAAWRRGDGAATPWLRRLPMVVSIALTLSVLTAMAQFISPVVDTFAERPEGPTRTFSELYTMASDGSRQTRLVALDGRHAFGPSWSPDGKRIAYSTGVETYGAAIANADGSGVRPLIASGTPEGYAGSWAPDGTRLAISVKVGDGFAIEVVDVERGGRTRLTSGTSRDTRPAFSPDGKRIAFASDRDASYQVYVMNADGTGVTRLTNEGLAWGAAWSPDGTHLAFNSDRTGRSEIYVMNTDGSDQRRLTRDTKGPSWEPAWSPDGRRIAFTSRRDQDSEIYAMNADGSDLVDLTRTPGLQEASPSWSKDGTIVYQSAESLPHDLVPDVRQSLGIAAILVQSALIAGLVVLALRRGGLPFGSLTLVLGVNTALMSVMSDEYRLIPGALIAGLASDVLVARLRPSADRLDALRAVAAFVPAAYVVAYLVTLALGGGLGWPVHLWTGSVVLAGATGLLISFATDDRPVRRSAAAP